MFSNFIENEFCVRCYYKDHDYLKCLFDIQGYYFVFYNIEGHNFIIENDIVDINASFNDDFDFKIIEIKCQFLKNKVLKKNVEKNVKKNNFSFINVTDYDAEKENDCGNPYLSMLLSNFSDCYICICNGKVSIFFSKYHTSSISTISSISSIYEEYEEKKCEEEDKGAMTEISNNQKSKECFIKLMTIRKQSNVVERSIKIGPSTFISYPELCQGSSGAYVFTLFKNSEGGIGQYRY